MYNSVSGVLVAYRQLARGGGIEANPHPHPDPDHAPNPNPASNPSPNPSPTASLHEVEALKLQDLSSSSEVDSCSPLSTWGEGEG